MNGVVLKIEDGPVLLLLLSKRLFSLRDAAATCMSKVSIEVEMFAQLFETAFFM